MSFLVRMIQPENWTQTKDNLEDISMISADSLSDLRTTENCISTWLVKDCSVSEIKKAIQALSSGFRTLDSIKIVVLDYEQLLNAGFTIDETEGDTKIDAYKLLHRDISHLNAGSLPKLAEMILQNIWANNIQDISKDTVGEWLLDAMIDEMLDFSKLEKNMKAALASFIDKRIRKGKIEQSKIPKSILDIISNQVVINSRKTTCQFEPVCERYKKAS